MIAIEEAGPEHTYLLSAMHKECFSAGWSVETFEDLMVSPGVFGLLAVEYGVPIGLVIGRVAADEAEILTIGVLPDHRRTGTGRTLARALISKVATLGANRIFLEVAETNRAALCLYRDCGFSQTGKRRGYYAAPPGSAKTSRVDAIIMQIHVH